MVAAIVIAVSSLWVLMLGLNLAQGTAWALLYDCCPRSQQVQAQSIMTAIGALSALATNLLGFINLVKIFPFFADSAHALFYIGMLHASCITHVGCCKRLIDQRARMCM
jgi:hypothetical protein